MHEDRGGARLSADFTSGILTVSQLNRSVRDVVEHRFPLLWVRGEISNCVVARSGHVYFALKDAQAQIRCVMFRSRASMLDWDPRDGIEVEVRGLVTLYEAKGDFQLAVETMRRAGQGALFETFQRLKEKLAREGLFDASVKRDLPFLPRSAGIVTSLQAAALRDVLTTLARRNPSIPVIVYPCTVQGDAAASSIVRALKRASSRAECDVLILCRGGGSMEDLWPFNEESVARAIRACPMPVVAGVGHETDFSIADFAADQRAPTPTAAAEMISPDRADLLSSVLTLARRFCNRLRRDLHVRMQAADQLVRRLAHPAQRLRDKAGQVAQLETRLLVATIRSHQERSLRIASLIDRSHSLVPRIPEMQHRLAERTGRLVSALTSMQERRTATLGSLTVSLAHLSPERVLERGYSVARDAAGRVITDAATLSAGEVVEINFSRGGALARVEATRRER